MPPTTRQGESTYPSLPELDTGVQLLEIADGHGISPLQSLVIDHVLLNDGSAMWVDAGRHAVTSSLRDLAPSDRVLDRIDVAWGFTAYQHTALLRHARDRLADESVSIVVVPAIDAQYRSDDVRGEAAQDMLLAALADTARLAREAGVPVLVTRQRADEFSDPVATLADRTIEYQSTAFGPRFVGDEWETKVYPTGDGFVQTTLAFWADVLAQRATLHDTASSAPKVVMSVGSN